MTQREETKTTVRNDLQFGLKLTVWAYLSMCFLWAYIQKLNTY